MSTAAAAQRPPVRAGRRVLLPVGLGLLALALVLGPPGGLGVPAWRCAVVAAVMALWWVSEALPLPVTALLPLAAFPLLGLGSFEATTAAYAHPLVMLFFGGFVVGIAIERHGLHLRLAHAMLRVAGEGARARLAGVMLAAALLSMWLNNTSTTLAMLPVALALVPEREPQAALLTRTLLLGVAYAATIGGLATLIGTAPNALLAAYLAKVHGVEVGFARYLLVGVPTSALLLAGAWLWLGRPLRGLAARVAAPPDPTPLTPAQRRVGAVFAVLVLAWLTRGLLARYVLGLSDAGIAVLAALALFIIPDGRRGALLAWEDLAALPWGVLVLFGGGLALGSAMETSGLARAIGTGLEPALGWPALAAVTAVVVTLVLLTELTSNTATAAAFLPIVGALAVASGTPVALLALPAALATSCAFMLPAGTPPNAIVFAGGHVTAAEMARAGAVLNLFAAAVLALLVPALVRLAGLAG